MRFPHGFRGAGVVAGLKSTGAKDLALIVNEGPQYFGTAVFTTNQVIAAPVIWSQQVVRDTEIRAVLLNSGGANACTGPEGFADTHVSAEKVGSSLNISAGDVAICSTGLIGVRLPMAKIFSGIEAALKDLSAENLQKSAEAIIDRKSTRLNSSHT